ncbi:hypothetical protein NKG05_28440 [Oerskovia sp. M15]
MTQELQKVENGRAPLTANYGTGTSPPRRSSPRSPQQHGSSPRNPASRRPSTAPWSSR